MAALRTRARAAVLHEADPYRAQLPLERRPRLVLVHSFNAPAALLMVAALKQAGIPASYEPFTCGPIVEGV